MTRAVSSADVLASILDTVQVPAARTA
jgi:hypothetical protein